jgi:ribosomal protein S12 methylthiotransferase
MLMRQQKEISFRLNRQRIGSITELLAEDYRNGIVTGRSYAEAPDADGSIYAKSEKEIAPGQFVNIRVTDASDYDLRGVVL